MVKYKSIVKIIDDYVAKCRTIAEIKQLLENMDSDEKYEKMKSVLTGAELKWYDYIIKVVNHQSKTLQEELQQLEDIDTGVITGWKADDKHRGYVEDDIARTRSILERYEPLRFDYEKRLFNGFKPREPQPVEYDESLYHEEVQETSRNPSVNSIGELELAQIKAQKDMDLTDDEVKSLIHYFGSSAEDVNSYLYNGHSWKTMDKTVKRKIKPTIEKTIENVSSAIDKSDGLLQDTVVYHGGLFDLSKVVGDDIVFKGYTSCSFQKNVAVHSMEVKSFVDELQYTYKFLLPKGTKGLCANDTSKGTLTQFSYENEFLLDKGFKGKIADIDTDNQVVTIVVSD